MGLSASQARQIALTARMNDIEYQGQQINQERTTLSNQVNALYNSLLDMSVPTPPSTTDYTRVEYTYAMNATQYTVASVLPDGDDHYRITCTYNAVGHYLDRPGTIYIDLQQERPRVRLSDGVYSDLYYLSEDEAQQGIGINMDEYIEAIQNRFPEYAHQSPSEIQQAFMVYFTDNNGLNEPHFIEAADLSNPTGDNYTYANRYDYISNGTYPAQREFTDCVIRFNEQGLISEVDIPTDDSASEYRTYSLTATTVTDQDAYNDAFNDYETAKYKYDKKQQEINAKTSIIQAEDKNLELKLTRLDNERNALKTELEAVKKVVQDAVESGFKTFSG